LHQRQQAEGILTPEEEVDEQALLALYRERIWVRAQAAVLLKHRSYDIENQAGVTR
jgi:hypothetical protein